MAATGNATTGGVGIVNLGVNDGLSTSSVLTINNVGPSVQTFNLAGFNQTLGGLATQAGGSATNSKVTLGSGNLTVNDGGNRTFAGEISGAGNVVKQGAGTWTLSSANTYNGTTTISGGTLLLSGGGSIANSSVITVGPSANLNVAAVSGFAIGTGQTLKGNGTVIGNTTINGNLQPGNSPGVLTMNGSLTLNSTATTTMEINGTTRGTDYDGIDLVGPNALTYGGILTLSFGTTFGVGNYTFDLFSFSSTPTGSFANVTLAGNYTGSLTNNSGVWSLTSGNNTWTFTQSTGDLGLSVIPEPTTSLMLAGSLTALVVFRRRRVH
jgi:autotransporter-associated beta strand protein